METKSCAKVVETKCLKFKNPIVIIGFPDVGLVGTIVTHYIIEELKLEEIGYIESRLFPPILLIRNEKIQNTVQISGNEEVIVFTSEIPIPLKILDELADAIITYLIPKNPKITFVIGGIPNLDRLEMKTINIYGIPTTPRASEILNKGNLQIFDEGVIIGTNALFLKKFFEEKSDCIGLLVDSFIAFPDPESSSVVIENLNKILGWNIDVKKLLEKGEEIRLNARDLMKKTKEALIKMIEPKEEEILMMYR